MTSSRWTTADIPDQRGRVAVVTGANSGLGLETARELARAGATTVLAVRTPAKGEEARREILAGVPGGDVQLQQLDLSSLASVATAAAELRDRFDRIDLLVNNAGVAYPPYRTTAEGIELQFGTNHLGHFALTGQLLDRLAGTEGARIVAVASIAHRLWPSRVDRRAVSSSRGYNPLFAYARSKMANLQFTYALQRRLAAAEAAAVAVAAHPGMSATELVRHIPRLLQPVVQVGMPLVTQPADRGALPQLRAATDPAVVGGQYYGPDGLGEAVGNPVLVRSNAASHDVAAQERLWALSEELTGVTYAL